LAIVFLEQLRQRQLDLPALLMVSNFTLPDQSPVGFWFIEVWVQIYLALFLAFAVLPLAAWIKRRRTASALGMLGVGVALRLLVPLVWDTDPLYNRVPHMLFWLFAVGFCVSVLGRDRRWLLGAIVLLTGTTLSSNVTLTLWVTLGGLAIVWVPPVRAPRRLTQAVAWTSAGSLYIYVTRHHFVRVAELLAPEHAGLLGLVLAVVGGGLLRVAADYAWSLLLLRGRSRP
jgi:hypothetical protein